MSMKYVGPGYYAITNDCGYAIGVEWYESREDAQLKTDGKCYYWGKEYKEKG